MTNGQVVETFTLALLLAIAVMWEVGDGTQSWTGKVTFVLVGLGVYWVRALPAAQRFVRASELRLTRETGASNAVARIRPCWPRSRAQVDMQCTLPEHAQWRDPRDAAKAALWAATVRRRRRAATCAENCCCRTLLLLLMNLLLLLTGVELAVRAQGFLLADNVVPVVGDWLSCRLLVGATLAASTTKARRPDWWARVAGANAAEGAKED